MEPSDPPLQLTSICVLESESTVGSVMVTVSVAVQLLSSVTVTVYVPAAKEPMSWVVEFEGSFQLYV